ncbi:hypothetical protein GCM10023201_24560 [Actinomycetospora corticicola]
MVTALHRFVRASVTRRAEPGHDRFVAMTEAAPSVRAYSQRMWASYASSLAEAVALDAGLGADDPRALALAHVVISALALDPAAIDAVFDLLRHGWSP